MEELVRGLIKTIFVQHQEFIPRDDMGAWLRRFALGYRLQKDLRVFDDKEWSKLMLEDLPEFFRENPTAASVWKKHMRKYWPKDTQKFIDGLIKKARAPK